MVYESGLEVEFGLTTRAWLATDPAETGSAQVVADGARELFDRTGALTRFVTAVAPTVVRSPNHTRGRQTRETD